MTLSIADPVLRAQADAVAGVLRAGGVAVIPTDTLYGLAACALDVSAVQRVFRIKGRPMHQALPALLANPGDFRDWARDIPEAAWALIERFLPGPLTLVLWRSAAIPDVLTGGSDTVALRIPAHPVPRYLSASLGAPITGTSANRTGHAPPATAQEAQAQLGALVDAVVDGGPAPLGRPSTVLDMTAPVPRVLREGAVPLADIEATLAPFAGRLGCAVEGRRT